MKRIKLALLVLICTGVLLHSQTEVTGTINNNTTWTTAGSPYIVLDDVVVPENVTLTIQAGVVVKFTDFWDNLVINGTLNSSGRVNAQIVYTSIHDDQHGGDSNNNGNATTAGSNQWSSVFISNTGTANFEYCWFGYGGGEHSGLIDVYSNDVTVENCSFNNSGQNGIYFEDASPTVIQSEFRNNISNGIYINEPSDFIDIYLEENSFISNNWAVYSDYRDNTSDIYLINNTASNCNRNGFGINGSMKEQNMLFGQNDFPFIVNGDLTIIENASLEISTGTVFKFNGFWDNIVCHGYMNASGTQSNPIVFTSVADDTHGGDSNNDLDQSVPAGNHWSTVYISPTGSADFDHCWFGYGGGEHRGLVDIYSNDVIISDCSFNNSGEHGVYFEDASPTIFWSAFNNNNANGIYINEPSDLLEVYLNENTFNANDWAIYADYRDSDSDIFLIDNIATNCNRNGFGINGSIVGENSFFGQNDFPFIVNGDLNIQENARLDISAGTVVKFNGFWDNIVTHGHLDAIGTQGSPIVFTSVHDDMHGGDTNNNLDQTLPAGNQWASIYVSSTGSANFEESWFGYGGGEHYGLLDVHTDEVTISNSSFNNSGDRGVYVQDASLHIYNSQFENNAREGILFSGTSDIKDIILEDNSFKANEWAAYADYRDNNASIILNNNLAENCSLNGFGINGTTSGNVVFDGQEDFAIIGNGDLTVTQGAELSITPGTLMKFNGFWDNLVVHGKLNALGNDTSPIVFTSIHDD